MSYCYIGESNINDNNNLDKMARRVNDMKKQNNSSPNGTQTQCPELNMRNDEGFYSVQGDYIEYKNGTMINDIITNNNKMNNKTALFFKENCDQNKGWNTINESDISLDTPSIVSNNEANIIEQKKNKKCVNFDLDSIDSLKSLESGESLLYHVRKCKECKQKLLLLIRKNNNERKNKHYKLESINIKNENSTRDDTDNNIFCKNISEIKEIATIIIIGCLIIIILDIAIKRFNQ